MRKERKHFTPEEKVAILRRHLVDQVPVSELCEELSLRPTVFYRWQKEFFENGAAAFQSEERPHRQSESPRFPEESLHLSTRAAVDEGPLAFGNARLTDRRAGRRWLFCREECKHCDSNHAKDHNVLGTILPVHPVRHGLRRHDCHREPMGKA
jgi:transposase